MIPAKRLAPNVHRPVSSAASSPGFALRQLAFVQAVFLRWWRIATPIGVFAAAIVLVGLTFTQEPVFESDAIIRVRREAPFIAFQGAHSRTDRFATTQLALLRTRAVLEPALDQVKSLDPERQISEVDTDWMSDRLKARIAQAEMVELRFRAPEAELARDALQSVLDSYLVYAQSIESTSEDRVIQLLNEERQNRKEIVNASRDKVRKEVEASGVVFADDELSSFLNNASFNAMEQMLIRTEVDIEVMNARLIAERERVETGESQAATNRELQLMIDSTPEVAALLESISEVESRIDTYMSRLSNPLDSPMVVRSRNELEQLNRELREARNRIRADAETEFREVSEEADAERLRAMEAQVASKVAVRDRLLDRVQEEKKRLSGEAIDVEFARDELARQEDIFDRISSRIVALQTERRAPDRVEIVDAPRVPKQPLPVNLKKPIAASLAAFMVPFVICFLFERVHERVANAEALAEGAGLRVFGETAKLPVHETHRDIEAFLPYRESVSSVGSLIRLSHAPNGNAKVVAMVSSVANEGKTHLATHLAAYLGGAQQYRTLLVEADLRGPSIRKLLGIEKGPGLSQVLNLESTIDEAIQTTFVPGYGELEILTAGSNSVSCLPLNYERLQDVFAELRQRYDYIVVDTSPILSTTEALPVAMLSDLNLLCVMKGHSRMAQIRNSIERLTHVDANIAGMVLNGVEPREYYSRYGRYYSKAETA